MQVPFDTLASWSVKFLAELITDMMMQGGSTPLPSPRVDAPSISLPAAPDGPFPMSALQRSYMVGREQGHGAWLHWESEVANFDEVRFTWAVRQLVERHEALRTLMTDDYMQEVT
jgi:yersiniabactin nonribosomal peptide synthetase